MIPKRVVWVVLLALSVGAMIALISFVIYKYHRTTRPRSNKAIRTEDAVTTKPDRSSSSDVVFSGTITGDSTQVNIPPHEAVVPSLPDPAVTLPEKAATNTSPVKIEDRTIIPPVKDPTNVVAPYTDIKKPTPQGTEPINPDLSATVPIPIPTGTVSPPLQSGNKPADTTGANTTSKDTNLTESKHSTAIPTPNQPTSSLVQNEIKSINSSVTEATETIQQPVIPESTLPPVPEVAYTSNSRIITELNPLIQQTKDETLKKFYEDISKLTTLSESKLTDSIGDLQNMLKSNDFRNINEFRDRFEVQDLRELLLCLQVLYPNEVLWHLICNRLLPKSMTIKKCTDTFSSWINSGKPKGIQNRDQNCPVLSVMQCLYHMYGLLQHFFEQADLNNPISLWSLVNRIKSTPADQSVVTSFIEDFSGKNTKTYIKDILDPLRAEHYAQIEELLPLSGVMIRDTLKGENPQLNGIWVVESFLDMEKWKQSEKNSNLEYWTIGPLIVMILPEKISKVEESIEMMSLIKNPKGIEKAKFTLWAICSGKEGHDIAYVRDKINPDFWYRLDDEKVQQQVPFAQVPKNATNPDDVPSVLFYMLDPSSL